MIPNIRVTAALLVLLLAGSALGADTITLTTGRTIEGVVLQWTEDRVQVEVDGAKVWFERRYVKSMRLGGTSGERTDTEPQVGSDPAQEKADVAPLVARLGSDDPEVRAAAAKELVAAWPASAPALDAALVAKSPRARIEAARLLGREELGDTSARVRRSLGDASPDVRLLAARTARHRAFRELEPELVKIMRSDPEWKVRQEALRTLEVVGSRRCLQPLVAQLVADEDPAHARRYRRVLEKLLRESHGDDVDAWRESVERVLYAGGKLASER